MDLVNGKSVCYIPREFYYSLDGERGVPEQIACY